MNHPSQAEAGKQAGKRVGIRETVEKALLDQAPTSVVIEPDGEIVYNARLVVHAEERLPLMLLAIEPRRSKGRKT